MAKHYNPGSINVEKAIESIVNDGGGVTERKTSDGSTHVSAYSSTSNRRFSYDVDSEGNISNVHSSKNGRSYTDYKGGY